MKSFLRRFQYYAIGFIIGLIFVIFFFQNRGCSWLPSNRVKNTLLDKVLVLPDSEKKVFESKNIDRETIISFLNDGDILFKESLKKQSEFPKAYIIEKEINNKNHRIQFSIYEDSYISPVHYLEENEKPQLYKNLKGNGDFIRLPSDSALIYIDRSNYVQCKARGLSSNSPRIITQNLKSTGKINFEKSDLMLPKAEHHISFVQDDTVKVEAKTIWFESRITFKDFYWDYQLECE